MNPVPTWQDIAQQQHDCTFMPAQALTIEQFIRLEMIKAYQPKTEEITHNTQFDGDVRVFTQYILTGSVGKNEAINHYRSVSSPLLDETPIVQ